MVWSSWDDSGDYSSQGGYGVATGEERCRVGGLVGHPGVNPYCVLWLERQAGEAACPEAGELTTSPCGNLEG